MGKTVYIVLAIVNGTVEVDSVWWNQKKAKHRQYLINQCSDGVALVIDKWVNPKILLSEHEYTNERVAKEKILDIPLIIDERCIKLFNRN